MSITDGYKCPYCGVWVGSLQVHNCISDNEIRGINLFPKIPIPQQHIAEKKQEKPIEIEPPVTVSLDELIRVYKLYKSGKLKEVVE